MGVTIEAFNFEYNFNLRMVNLGNCFFLIYVIKEQGYQVIRILFITSELRFLYYIDLGSVH